MISADVWKAVKRHRIIAELILRVKELDGTLIDELQGIATGGSINVDGNSAVRRTSSFTLTPTKQITDISEKSLVWLNKNVEVILKVNNETFYMGNFLYQSANTTYDATTNTLSIELSDWMTSLDGTINGQVGGALTTTIPAYKEDPDTGEPLEYSTIKGAIEKTLESVGMTHYVVGTDNPLNTFIVDDVGEYYAMPQYNPDYLAYRDKYPLWDAVPYDLEFSTGCTVWEIIEELVNLYPNYDAAFDERGVFRVRMIPSDLTDGFYESPFDFTYPDYMDMVISEQVSTDLTTVRNICEVWGQTMDADWYADGVNHNPVESYDITFSSEESVKYLHITKTVGCIGGGTATWTKDYNTSSSIDEDWKDIHITYQNQALTLTSKYTSLRWNNVNYSNGSIFYTCTYNNWGTLPDGLVVISMAKTNLDSTIYVVPLDGYPKDYRTSTRFAVKFTENSYSGQLMRINDLEALVVYDFTTGQAIGADFFDLNKIHIFQLIKVKVGEENNEDVYACQIYYMGISQPHAINVLTDGTEGEDVEYIDDQGVTRTCKKWSKKYYQVFLNCEDVTFTVDEYSPFVVQKLGNRISVKADGEFSNIRSKELCIERAEYENWKNARLCDTVTVTVKLMPFVVPNMKINYKKQHSLDYRDYLVQSVSHDLDQGTTTMTLVTFRTLYIRKPGECNLMTYDYMGGFTNDELYGNEDQ